MQKVELERYDLSKARDQGITVCWWCGVGGVGCRQPYYLAWRSALG